MFQGFVLTLGAFGCLFPLAASVFEFDLLIYPAGMFWRRFGIFGFVGEKIFSAKIICMGKGGGCATILTHGHTKSAHISHIFSETPYRVARDLLPRRATLSRPQGPCTALQGEAPETPPRAQGEPSYPVEVVQGR